MKYIFLVFLSIFVLSVYSQGISSRDLLGSYEWIDALEPTEFEFTSEGSLLIKTADRTVTYFYCFENSPVGYLLRIYAPIKFTYQVIVFSNSSYIFLADLSNTKKEIQLKKIP